MRVAGDLRSARGISPLLMRSSGMGLRLAFAGAFAVSAAVACTGGDDQPPLWFYCTTNPCQPLALAVDPTPPALTLDASLAAPCDRTDPGAGDGVLLWHTDWNPETDEGICVSPEEAEDRGAP